jgi:hypothetical protein
MKEYLLQDVSPIPQGSGYNLYDTEWVKVSSSISFVLIASNTIPIYLKTGFAACSNQVQSSCKTFSLLTMAGVMNIFEPVVLVNE